MTVVIGYLEHVHDVRVATISNNKINVYTTDGRVLHYSLTYGDHVWFGRIRPDACDTPWVSNYCLTISTSFRNGRSRRDFFRAWSYTACRSCGEVGSRKKWDTANIREIVIADEHV